MPTISVCCIARNEEELLPGMISGVQDLADEILVLDTGSTDDTAEVARQHGARVFSMPWENDFGAARTALLREAKSDWILMLDADERLEAPNHERIRKALGPRRYAFACTVLNILPHPLITCKVPLRSTRLFRNHESLNYEQRVHENLSYSLRKLTWEERPSDIEIHHYGFSVPQEMRRLRNRRVFESELMKDPTDAWIRFHLGLHYFLAREYDRAEEYITNTLASQSSDIGQTTRSILLAMLAEIFHARGKSVLARSQAIKAIQMGGNLYAAQLLAQLDVEEERHESAVRRFLEVDADSLTQQYYSVHKGQLYAEISKCYLKMKDPDKALQYAELAKDGDPSYDAMFIGGYLCEQRKEFKRALKFYDIALKLRPDARDLLKRIAACRVALTGG